MTSLLHKRWLKYATASNADALPWIEKIRGELHEHSVNPAVFSEQTAIPAALHHLSQPVPSLESLEALRRVAINSVTCAHASIELLLRILSRNTLSLTTSAVSPTILSRIRTKWNRIWKWLAFFLETYPLFPSHDIFPQAPLPSEAYKSAVSVTTVLCSNVHLAEVSEEIPQLLQLLFRLWKRGPVFTEADYRRVRLAMHSFLITKTTSVIFVSTLCSAIEGREAEAAKLLLTNIGESSKFALESGEYGFLEPDLLLLDMLAAESQDTGPSARPLFIELLKQDSLEVVCDLLYKVSTTVTISSELVSKGHLPLSVLQLLLRHVICALVIRGRPYVVTAFRHRFLQSTVRFGALLARASVRPITVDYRMRIGKAEGMLQNLLVKMQTYLCFYSVVKEAAKQIRYMARRTIYQEILGACPECFQDAWRKLHDDIKVNNRQRAIHDETCYVCAYKDCNKESGSGNRPALCSGCRVNAYCSVLCQRQDWSSHRSHCRDYRGQRLAAYPESEAITTVDHDFMVWQQRTRVTKTNYAEVLKAQAQPSILILNIYSNEMSWQHYPLKDMYSDPRSAAFPEYDTATATLVVLMLPKSGGDITWTCFTMPLSDLSITVQGS